MVHFMDSRRETGGKAIMSAPTMPHRRLGISHRLRTAGPPRIVKCVKRCVKRWMANGKG